MRVECAVNMCNKYEATEWQVHEPKMVSREIRPSNFPKMTDEFCTLHILAKIKQHKNTPPQTHTHATQRVHHCFASRKNDQRKHSLLSPLSPHHFPHH